jgi:hypothetical protein
MGSDQFNSRRSRFPLHGFELPQCRIRLSSGNLEALVWCADKERRTWGGGGAPPQRRHPLPSPAPSKSALCCARRTASDLSPPAANKRSSTRGVINHQRVCSVSPPPLPRCSGCCAWLHRCARILGCWGVDRAGRYALACALVLHMLVKAVRLNPGGLRYGWPGFSTSRPATACPNSPGPAAPHCARYSSTLSPLPVFVSNTFLGLCQPQDPFKCPTCRH